MASLYQRGGVWYSLIRINGRRVRKPLHTSKSRALEMLAELVREQRLAKEGRYGEDGVAMTFLAFEKAALAHVDRVGGYGLRSVTRRALINMAAAVPVKYLSEINADYMYRVKKRWQEQGRVYVDPKTKMASGKVHGCNIELMMIRKAVRWAEKKYGLPSRDWGDDFFFVPVKKSRAPKFFEREELDRLEAAAFGYSKTMYMLCYLAGLRRAEARWLWWDDIDFEHNIIRIRSKTWRNPKRDREEFWSPKADDLKEAGSERDVPLTAALKDYLLGIRGAIPGQFILCDVDGYPPGLGTMTKRWVSVIEAAGIKDRGRRALHALRHSYAVHYLRNGGDIYKLSKYLGHSSLVMTEIYAKYKPTEMDPALESLLKGSGFKATGVSATIH